MAPIKIALIGLGKIARDEHIPALDLGLGIGCSHSLCATMPGER